MYPLLGLPPGVTAAEAELTITIWQLRDGHFRAEATATDAAARAATAEPRVLAADARVMAVDENYGVHVRIANVAVIAAHETARSAALAE